MLIIFRFRKKKIAFTVHNVIPHESSLLDMFLTKIVLFFGDAFIVHSKENEASLVQNFRIPNKAIYQIHMPVHDMYGGEYLSSEESREKINISNQSRVILSFGNLRGYKGIDTLIRAFPDILERVPNAILLIVGQPWGDWTRCEKLIDDLEIGRESSTSIGVCPDVPGQILLFRLRFSGTPIQKI